MKHHLSAAKTPGKLFKKIKELEDNDKRMILRKKECLGGYQKIPIASTFDELVEMDFSDYGDYAAFFFTFELLFRVSLPLFFRG